MQACPAGQRAVVCLQTMRGMIFKWLRDRRYMPEVGSGAPASAADATGFLPVEIVDQPGNDDTPPATAPAPGMIEIDIAGGHNLRISGAYDPDALVRLIRGLSA
jgi:transposase